MAQRYRICAQNGLVHAVRKEPTLTLRGYTVCDELFTYGPTYLATDLGGAIVPHVTRDFGVPTCLWCVVTR